VEVAVEIKDILRRAYKYATLHSKDTNTHVGAVLVSDNQADVFLYGVNQFTSEQYYSDASKFERPLKYMYTEHAERDAIFKAARAGYCTQGLTLYCPWASCPACARAIVLSGIKRVIGHKQAYDRTPQRWTEEIGIGHQILRDGDVEFVCYDGKLDYCKNLMNGEIWYP
jgi:dCMP deaminase